MHVLKGRWFTSRSSNIGQDDSVENVACSSLHRGKGSLVNPSNDTLSDTVQKVLADGPKFCHNIRHSKLDLVSPVQVISKRNQ